MTATSGVSSQRRPFLGAPEKKGVGVGAGAAVSAQKTREPAKPALVNTNAQQSNAEQTVPLEIIHLNHDINIF